MKTKLTPQAGTEKEIKIKISVSVSLTFHIILFLTNCRLFVNCFLRKSVFSIKK